MKLLKATRDGIDSFINPDNVLEIIPNPEGVVVVRLDGEEADVSEFDTVVLVEFPVTGFFKTV
jgi:hypothetical protein